MNLTAAILSIMPIAEGKFIAQDNSDGNGPFIAEWTHSQPQPSAEAIAAAWQAIQTTEITKAANESRCRTLATQLKAGFDSFAVAERAAFYALRLALENALLKDFDADVAKQLLIDDTASESFPQVKAGMIALFD